MLEFLQCKGTTKNGIRKVVFSVFGREDVTGTGDVHIVPN